jgi:hypothetical protein
MILIREGKPEFVLFPCCLLTYALTVPAFNTNTRCELLETGYFFLKLYEKLMTEPRLPSGVTQTIAAGSLSSLSPA